MSYKKWLQISLATIFIVLFFNTLFLYLVDTYHIAKPQSISYTSIPNQKYLITEYFLNNKPDYDTLIFGSSRVGAINPLHIKKAKAYNMTYGEGVPREHLLIIKLFIENNIPIKHILLGLDEFSYQVAFSTHQNQLTPKSHYLASNETIFNFYKFYFLRKIDKKDIKNFKLKYFKDADNLYVDVYDSIFRQKEAFANIKYIDNSHKDYAKNPIFLIPTVYSGDEVDNTLNDLEEIIDLTKKNNIKLSLFINPIHHTTYKHTNQKQFKEFKNKLSKITAYYDFSLPNSINNNNINWLETSHYLPHIGDMIIDRIYEINTSLQEFGVYVKKRP